MARTVAEGQLRCGLGARTVPVLRSWEGGNSEHLVLGFPCTRTAAVRRLASGMIPLKRLTLTSRIVLVTILLPNSKRSPQEATMSALKSSGV